MNINLIISSLKVVVVFTLLTFLSNCGFWDPADARKVDPNAQKRAEKNIQEGKGFRIKDAMDKGGSGSFQFASSNEMWRATLSLLSFTPLSNVDYSGGIIITDWYNEGAAGNESIKITVRFLTNQIRADGLKIIVHKKKCNLQQKCAVRKVTSALENELQVAILRKAAIFEQEYIKKNKKKRPKVN